MRQFIFILLFSSVSVRSLSQNVGIGVTSPSDKLHINSGTGEDPLRVQVNAVTKLRIHSNGGTGIGAGLLLPPENGLVVQGPIQPQNGIQTANKLVVESTGDSIILKAGGSEIIIAANGNIVIKGDGANLTIDAVGTLTLKGSAVSIQSTAGLTMTAGGTMSLTTPAQMVLNGGTQIGINASTTRFNNGSRGLARLNDATAGSEGSQTIVTASNNVFTN